MFDDYDDYNDTYDVPYEVTPSGSSEVLTGQDMVDALDSLEPGTPVLIDDGVGRYIQVIYMGIGEVQYQTVFQFYDGSGISGTFGFSAKFIVNNPDKVSIILDDNDPAKVTKLLEDVNATTSVKRRFRVDASKKIKAGKSPLSIHKAFDDLDDRFDFELDDEFEIYVGNERVPCFVTESFVFGYGSGVTYTIVTPVFSDNHWQMSSWIQRGLDEYFKQETDGSDYTYGLGATGEANIYEPDIPDATAYYVTDVDIYPYQNVNSYGEYGIDNGLE